jgi:moderate conductance mechanosensitive channel
MGLKIALVLIVAIVVQRVLFALVARTERLIHRSGYVAEAAEQRARTLGHILRNLITTLLAIGVVVQILAILGWDVRPLLAGAGIVGVALGFGAQTLVRDVIAGMFILAENQYSVGDLIEVNGRPATVEAITARSTTLRDFNGFVHFVPNGEMKTVVNRSRGWNRATVDIGIPIGQNVDQALALCRRAAQEMSTEGHWRERLLEPVQVLGLDSVAGADVIVRMIVKARPGGDLPEASRELRLRAVRALSTAGIQTTPVAAAPVPQSSNV